MKEKMRFSGLTPDLLPQKLRWGSRGLIFSKNSGRKAKEIQGTP